MILEQQRGEIAPVTEVWPLQAAGRGRRLGTLLIDQVALILVAGLIGIAFWISLGDEAMQEIPGSQELLLSCMVTLCYYLFFESLWACTPGKLIMGTRVVSDSGQKPSFGQVLLRTLCRFIPFDQISFFSSRGWHDSLSKTHVVRTRKN